MTIDALKCQITEEESMEEVGWSAWKREKLKEECDVGVFMSK